MDMNDVAKKPQGSRVVWQVLAETMPAQEYGIKAEQKKAAAERNP